jgi:S4 domain
MSDYPRLETVRDYLLDHGCTPITADRWVRYGRVRVDGVVVTNPYQVISPGGHVKAQLGYYGPREGL